MSIMNLVSLLAGLGLFLFGMHLMGEELEKAAGTRLKKLLEAVTRNRFLAMLAGIVITAVVQSSTATTVMVVGFVNAGLLSLTQAIGVIMGANIGTTITSLLLSVKIDIGAIFACIGLLMTVMPKRLRGTESIGRIAIGLGILFVGMNTMSNAMVPLRDWPVFRQAILSIDSPILGVLLGAVITAILHSSAASIGILQALVGEGLIPLHTAMFILFGQNIGTCLTSLVASSGTGTAARRTAVVHLLFNLSGTILFTVITASLPFADWVTAMAPGNLRLQIALTHIIFNITTTLLLLPLAGLLEKAACLLVPDKDSAEMRMRLRFDDRMLNTPAIAVVQLFRETQRMGDMARQNLEDAMQCFTQYDAELSAHVQETEDVIDFLNRAITAKLVEVNGLDLNEADTRLVGSMFHVVSDFERVGDHAENVLDSARTREEEGIRFSAKVMSELEDLYGKVLGQLKTAQEIFRSQTVNLSLIDQVEAVEDDIDNETEELRKHHVERLKNRKCSARNGALYLDMLTNLERIADHAENIATSVDKPA